jgi:hypothetical protein
MAICVASACKDSKPKFYKGTKNKPFATPMRQCLIHIFFYNIGTALEV